MTQRTPVSKALRFQVLRRDNFACRYCGANGQEAVLTIDHVVPVALGGETVAENLCAACQDCNAGKSATPPDATQVEDVQADATRWAQAMRDAAAIQASRWEARETYIELVDEAWSQWTWNAENRTPVPRPDNWHESIGRWFDLGLELELITGAVEKAMRKPLPPRETWRYFCGICWGILRERAEMAREMLASEGG